MSTDYVSIPVDLLKQLFDTAVGSLNFSSDFWDTEETEAARKVAEILGVCPNAGTPRGHADNYPACKGQVGGIHYDHDTRCLRQEPIMLPGGRFYARCSAGTINHEGDHIFEVF